MRAFITFLISCASLFALAQAPQDSVKFFTKGDITNQVFTVEEILVRQTCECVGDCTCDNPCEETYNDDRFSSTEKIMMRSGRIDMIKRGNFGFEPVLNGMSSDRMNITIDGMKIFGACTDKMDPVTSYIETNNLKNFTIQNGASGAKYGSSIAGSVNMETTGATITGTSAWRGEIGAGYNSVANGYNTLLSLNKSSERWAVNLNGVYRNFDSYKVGGGEVLPFSYFEKWNGALSAKYKASERDYLSADIIIDEGYNIGYPALPMDVGFAKAKIFGLTYLTYPRSENVDKITFKLYGNTVAHAMDDTKRPHVHMHMDMPGWTTTYGAFADAEMSFKNHSINVKLDGYHNNTHAEMTMYPPEEPPMLMLTWPHVDKLSLSAFLQDRYKISDVDLISVNARIELMTNNVRDQFGIDQATIFNQDISQTDYRILKSVGITYQRSLSANVRSWITTGYTERAPSVNEQYAFYTFNAYDGYDYIGNVDLQNEKSLQAELGIAYNLNDDFSLSANGYYYRMYDYILGKIKPHISPMTHGSNGVKMSENIDGATLTGFTFSADYVPHPKIEVSSRFSYAHGSTDAGDPLPLIPPLKNISSVAYLISDIARISLQFEGALAQNRLNSDFGETSTPAYALLHLRGGYVFKLKKNSLSANGGIENIFDTKYYDHLDWGGIPRPGRNFYLNLSFGF